MKLLREVAAIAVFIAALIAFAGGVYWLAVAWAVATQNQKPIDVVSLAGGLLACALGVLFLVISRALDQEHGPVRNYRQRSRKSHTHA